MSGDFNNDGDDGDALDALVCNVDYNGHNIRKRLGGPDESGGWGVPALMCEQYQHERWYSRANCHKY